MFKENRAAATLAEESGGWRHRVTQTLEQEQREGYLCGQWVLREGIILAGEGKRKKQRV